MTGFSSDPSLQDFEDPLLNDDSNPLSPPAEGNEQPAERDRTFYSPIAGVVTDSRWENPNDPKQGYGYEVRIRGKDGTTFRFGHVDPGSLVVAPNARISKGDPIGHYADPPTGRATGPHLHVEKRLPSGEPINPADDLPIVMPNHSLTSRFKLRQDPITGQPGQPHYGADIVGPVVTP